MLHGLATVYKTKSFQCEIKMFFGVSKPIFIITECFFSVNSILTENIRKLITGTVKVTLKLHKNTDNMHTNTISDTNFYTQSATYVVIFMFQNMHLCYQQATSVTQLRLHITLHNETFANPIN